MRSLNWYNSNIRTAKYKDSCFANYDSLIGLLGLEAQLLQAVFGNQVITDHLFVLHLAIRMLDVHNPLFHHILMEIFAFSFVWQRIFSKLVSRTSEFPILISVC